MRSCKQILGFLGGIETGAEKRSADVADGKRSRVLPEMLSDSVGSFIRVNDLRYVIYRCVLLVKLGRMSKDNHANVPSKTRSTT